MNERNLSGFFLIPASILLQAVAAVCGKYGSLAIGEEKLEGLETVLGNPAYLLSLFFLGLQALVWQLALRRFPLAWAYFFNSFLYILILLAGHLFFAEPVSAGNIAGTLLIIAGIAVLVRAKLANGKNA